MDPAMAVEVAALSNLRAIAAATARGDSDVQRFYNNSVVFLTGGSGFLGKQLIEKLLRSCHISKVFILLRSKKGKNVQERLNEILEDPAFESLRQQQPNIADKIKVIEGDVAELKLGIKDEDWRTLIEEVNVIFHVAATTRFDETLRTATLINVRGTREALLLGKTCKNLKSYVHVSTAYSHATAAAVGSEVDEKFYNAPVPPETMISMVESMEADRLTNITPALIKNWPNTYTFTKSISEELVRTMTDGLPICIVRPAIVLCTYREPAPGWVDVSCIYGATGILLGIALGVLHVIHVNPATSIGTIPCDYVNNAIIVAGRETSTSQLRGGNNTKIYTVSPTIQNPVTWSNFEKVLLEYGPKFTPPKAVYYCFALCTSSKSIFMVVSFLAHTIPACMADFVCLLLGKQRRPISGIWYFSVGGLASEGSEIRSTMISAGRPYFKLANKMNKMSSVLNFFLHNEWTFLDHNLKKLFNSLSNQDKTIFNFDIANINWTEFIITSFLGVRRYIIKDGLKDTEYAIKKQRFLRVLHYILTPLYLYGIWKIICLAFYIGCIVASVFFNIL